MTPQPDIAPAAQDEIEEAEAPIDPARAALERQMAGLERLAEIGLEIVEAIAAQVRDAEKAFDGAAVSLAYHRTARAVRMNYALQTEVIEALRDLDRRKAFDTAHADHFRAAGAAAASMLPKTALQARKARIGQAMSTVLAREHAADHGSETHERHVREASERLKDADDLGDILTRPISEIIAQVCQDLGLDPDWEGLAGEAWALEEVRSGRVGGPFKSPKPTVHPDESRDPGFFSPQPDEPNPMPTGVAPDPSTSETQNTWVPTSVGMNPEGKEAPAPPPEPPRPPEPYIPPRLEDIYSAEAVARELGRTPPLGYDPAGLPGELPPLRRDGRPAPYILPPRNYKYGWD